MRTLLRLRSFAFLLHAGLYAAQDASVSVPPTFKQYCFSCHGKGAAMAGVNLEKLTSQTSFGESFQHWEKVAGALEQHHMPPKKMPQPSDEERGHAVAWIRGQLKDFAQKHAGDPGAVTMRRLTSGEYAYTVQDLTGLNLKFDRDFASDSVGGEGFTNFGDVQFMEDANLERYLEAAKRIAGHAVIGSGPLGFYEDPGKSGLELSAVSRIQDIYTRNGFRAAAGEGGKPYGLDRYGKAFYAAWKYQHRAALGEPGATLEAIGTREGLTPRFVRHIWSVVQQTTPTYPTSEVVAKFRALPAPRAGDSKAARAGADEIQKFLIEWPRWLFDAGPLAAGGAGDERALIISETTLPAAASHKLRYNVRRNKQNIARIQLTSVPVNPGAKDKTVVIWRNAAVRIRKVDRTKPQTEQVAVSQQRPLASAPQTPLKALLDQAALAKLNFGKLPDGTAIGPDEFATAGDSATVIEIPMPEDAGGLELQVEAVMGPAEAKDAVLRLTMNSGSEVLRGRPVWALLADPKSEGYQAWRKSVFEFAANLPQASHGEPTPSDNDPIPAPFNNTYNQPERNFYHTKVKYYRQDQFLVEKMLDDPARLRLEQAWTDLLTSFEYHDAYVRFVAEKFDVPLKKTVAELTDAELDAFPVEMRPIVKRLRAEYVTMKAAQSSARPGHVEDAVKFASKAWRRPLSDTEKIGLRAFYKKASAGPEAEHAKALRALLARVLIAPAFLYRLEQPARLASVKPLTDWEMANRLSYFLWSSMPDDELRRAAGAGELSKPVQLERQVKRMLADEKARRFSTEFFGQWLGFYRFDQYRGVDTGRFPEFTDEVKAGMYDEAVSFFEHVVRKDRPVREMLFADYTFLNKALAKHYGIKKEIQSTGAPELVEGANAFQRGGLLRLGAVLTATSAPLRTSPVKRGDWVLRRVLGTPTPPPPADAGSIPADDKAFGGMSVFERLAAHQRNATCASCHSRIDPMGFPLEKYDAVGRWREQYSDGKPIRDDSALADKTPIAGVDGLLTYLKNQEQQVLRTMSHKLLGYALGRTVLGSDQPLVERLIKPGNDVQFSKLVTEIVASRQFRYRRERADVPGSPPQQNSGSPAVKSSDKAGGL